MSKLDKLKAAAKGQTTEVQRPGWMNRIEGMGNKGLSELREESRMEQLVRGIEDFGLNRNL